ncbi:FAD-dependent monooxygenase [Microbacterium allomyrinae]|uniref:FAD-dependent monooxygenase n=1 Tax=Microbacterium allomyrinae TaxID=2830666 RepID=A0A9X1LXN4_9MICO|nr:FAD-dependent monooxygenase [Microbacterium allomyrinae]MCC2033245.1 FAD-dependent monooxygenase [Microbacterium allomyrinae]
MTQSSILILGAGIGGLAASIALAQSGHDVTVIEKHPGLRSSTVGVGIIQQPNQLRALAAIGCADACIAVGYAAAYSAKHLDADGAVVRAIPGPRVAEFPEIAMNGITRPKLHRVLTERALAVGVSIEYDKTITAVRPRRDHVEVDVSDGTTRTPELLVGADGVRSIIRAHVYDEPVEPAYSGKSVLRINVPRLPEIDAILRQERLGDDGERIGVGFVPLADDLGYMYLNIVWDRSVRPDTEELRELMRSYLAGFGGPAGVVRDDYLDAADEIVLRPEEYLIAPGPWHRGRIVLLGDAVHAVTPNTAQGAALAIEDGVVLAEELAANDDLESALQAYGDRRYERCKRVVDYGANARKWEFDPTPDFDPVEEGIRMREAVVAPF